MKEEILERLSDEVLLKNRDRHFAQLAALFDGEESAGPIRLWGVCGQPNRADPIPAPEKWFDEVLDNLAKESQAQADEAVFRPLVVQYLPYGVRFIDKLFGVEVHKSDLEDTWWADGLETPVGSLECPDLDRNEDWRRARDMVDLFHRSGVSVPLFSQVCVSSPLNIAFNLYGQQFFTALLEDPDAVRHDLEIITYVLCSIHRWYINCAINQPQMQPVVSFARVEPAGYGQICGCATQLISAEQYEEFIAPLDDAVLSLYPNGGMIHLCGAHTQHIPVWRRLKSFRAFQVNDRAAEDLPTYFSELRQDQIIYLNPTARVTSQRGIEITGGKRLVIVENPDAPVAATDSDMPVVGDWTAMGRTKNMC